MKLVVMKLEKHNLMIYVNIC